MKEITQDIDVHYLTLYPDYKFWGLAELTDASKDRFPVTVNERHKVGLDDEYDCVVWYRVVSARQVDNEDLAFGIDIPTEFRVTLRTVVGYKIELGEHFTYEFMDNFPKDLPGTGYEKLEVVPGVININHEEVAKVEEINTHYDRHRLCWNVFSFDNEIQFVLCPETSP